MNVIIKLNAVYNGNSKRFVDVLMIYLLHVGIHYGYDFDEVVKDFSQEEDCLRFVMNACAESRLNKLNYRSQRLNNVRISLFVQMMKTALHCRCTL